MVVKTWPVVITTTIVMPVETHKGVCNKHDIWQQEYVKFVEERINTNEVSVLGRRKQIQLNMSKRGESQ